MKRHVATAAACLMINIPIWPPAWPGAGAARGADPWVGRRQDTTTRKHRKQCSANNQVMQMCGYYRPFRNMYSAWFAGSLGDKACGIAGPLFIRCTSHTQLRTVLLHSANAATIVQPPKTVSPTTKAESAAPCMSQPHHLAPGTQCSSFCQSTHRYGHARTHVLCMHVPSLTILQKLAHTAHPLHAREPRLPCTAQHCTHVAVSGGPQRLTAPCPHPPCLGGAAAPPRWPSCTRP